MSPRQVMAATTPPPFLPQTPASRPGNDPSIDLHRALPVRCASAPVPRPGRRRSGRDRSMVVDILYAVATQGGRRLEAGLIAGVGADLRRAAGAIDAAAQYAERRRAGGGRR